MSTTDHKAILENVKRVEKEELEKIAQRLKEWTNSNKKDSKASDLTTSTSSKSSKKENSEDKDTDKKKEKKRKTSEPESTSKSEKSSKRGKTEEPKKEKPAETINPKWQDAAVALEGDNSRKSKFMRLMGAGKVDVPTPSSAPSSGKFKGELKKREEELGKQFEHGLKMKNEVGAKRRGLGA